MTQMKPLPLYSAQNVKQKTMRMPDFALTVAPNLTFNIVSEVRLQQTN